MPKKQNEKREKVSIKNYLNKINIEQAVLIVTFVAIATTTIINIKSLNAYKKFQSTTLRPWLKAEEARPDSYYYKIDKEGRVNALFTFTNYGKTPAINICIATESYSDESLPSLKNLLNKWITLSGNVERFKKDCPYIYPTESKTIEWEGTPKSELEIEAEKEYIQSLNNENKIKIYIVLIYKYNNYYSENVYWHIKIYERIKPHKLKFFKSIYKTL